jgi:hypothetical protein
MTIEQLDAKLNGAILAGKAMDAFEELYDDQVVMQENSAPPTAGKAANREREIAFFSSLEAFHGARILSTAAASDVSFSEWELDVTFKGAGRVQWTQAVVRRWKNGKVAAERFYYAK